MKSKKALTQLYLYIISFIIIFQSYTVFQYRFNKISSIFKYILVILIVFSIITLIKKKSFIINYNKIILFLIVYSIYFIIYILFNTSNWKYIFNIYIFDFFTIFLLLLYCKVENLNIFKSISNLIIAYSCINLLLFISISIFHLVQPNIYFELSDVNKINYSSYNYIFFESHFINFFGFNIARNCGIFLEPAVYSIFIINSLIIELFFRKKVKFLNVLILLMTSITTISTTCYILIIVVLGVKFILYNNNKKNYKVIKLYLVPIISIIAIFGIYYFFDLKSNLHEADLFTRKQDLLTGIVLFKQKPFLGWGIGNFEEFLNMQTNNYGLYSNGMITLFYQGGIYIFSLYLFGAISFIRSSKDKNDLTGKILFTVILFIELSIFPFQFSILAQLYLAYGLIFIVTRKKSKQQTI